MGKKEFWLRFSLWFIFAALIPVCFLFFKYGLFSQNSGTKLTGWGVFAIFVIAIVLIVLIKDVVKGLPPHSMLKQCIKGFLGLLPLLMVILLLHAVKNTIAEFEEFLIVLFVCEAVAVPINPFPKWAVQNKIDFGKTTFGEISRGVLSKLGKKSDKGQ